MLSILLFIASLVASGAVASDTPGGPINAPTTLTVSAIATPPPPGDTPGGPIK